MENIKKNVRSEIRKWISFDLNIYLINDKKSECYSKISLGDNEDKKNLLFYYII